MLYVPQTMNICKGQERVQAAKTSRCPASDDNGEREPIKVVSLPRKRIAKGCDLRINLISIGTRLDPMSFRVYADVRD